MRSGSPDGIDVTLSASIELCQRMHATLTQELAQIDGVLHMKAKQIDAVKRLETIPAVGEVITYKESPARIFQVKFQCRLL